MLLKLEEEHHKVFMELLLFCDLAAENLCQSFSQVISGNKWRKKTLGTS